MFQGEDGGARQTHMKEMGRAAWGRTGSLWSCRKYKLFKKKKRKFNNIDYFLYPLYMY